jgi:hypothetical protein
MLRPPEDEDKLRQELREKTLEKDTKEPPPLSLGELVPDNQMLRKAMEYFLLGSPERQLVQLGDVNSLRTEAEKAKAKGDKIRARIHYESAAKVALYEDRLTEFKQSLLLANEVTGKNERYFEFHRTLLQNLDEVRLIADKFYSQWRIVSQSTTSMEAVPEPIPHSSH